MDKPEVKVCSTPGCNHLVFEPFKKLCRFCEADMINAQLDEIVLEELARQGYYDRLAEAEYFTSDPENYEERD